MDENGFPDTKFVGSNILLAVIREDYEEAIRIADTMTRGEIHRLRVALGEMDHVLKDVWRDKIRKEGS